MSCEDLRKRLNDLVKASKNDQSFYDFQLRDKHHITRILNYSSIYNTAMSNQKIGILNDKFVNTKGNTNSDPNTTWTSIVSTMGFQLCKIANTINSDKNINDDIYVSFLRGYFCELFDFMKYLFQNGLNPSIHYTTKGDKHYSFLSLNHTFQALKLYYINNDDEVIKQMNEILLNQFNDIIPSLLTLLITKHKKKCVEKFCFGSMLHNIDRDLTPNMIQNLLMLGYPMINVVYVPEPVPDNIRYHYDYSKYSYNNHNFDDIMYMNDDLTRLCVIQRIARKKLWDSLHSALKLLLPDCVTDIILDYHMGLRINEREEICTMDWFFETLILNTVHSTQCNYLCDNKRNCNINLETIQRPLLRYQRCAELNLCHFNEMFSLMKNINGFHGEITIPSRVTHLLIDKLYQRMQDLLNRYDESNIHPTNYHPSSGDVSDYDNISSKHVFWLQLLENDSNCFYSDGWRKILDLWTSYNKDITFAKYVMETVFTKYYWFEHKQDPIWLFVQLLLKNEHFQQIFVNYNYLKFLSLHNDNVHKIKLLVYNELIPNHYALNSDYIISIIQVLLSTNCSGNLQCSQLLLWWALKQCKKYKNIDVTAPKYVAYLNSVQSQCDIFTEYLQKFQNLLY